MVLFPERFKKLPVLVTIGSFLMLLGIIILTNPLESIGIIFAFFCLLFIALVSAGVAVSGSQKRYRLVIISVFIVLLLMFRSNKSLGFVDSLILLLTCVGLYFYFSRKP